MSAPQLTRVLTVAGLFLVGFPAGAFAQPAGACDLAAYTRSQAEFDRLMTLRRFAPGTVTAEGMRAAAVEVTARGEACYQTLYSKITEKIDEGGLRVEPEGIVAQPYVTIGTKWGAGTGWLGGRDVPGPGLPGGTVTYSYMANGVSMNGDPPANAGPNVAISSLPGFQTCFTTRINTAFAIWSAVANIQFVQVADNGLPFQATGAAGDIRIGAHTFDGPSNILAHAYYPPPNGGSAAGDMHFDRQENWSCSPGSGIDIGIVAIHEIGHTIGLAHELFRVAIMNATYNPSGTPTVQADDINGAASIYGMQLHGPLSSDDLVADLTPALGLWTLFDGDSWAQLHSSSPEDIVTGNLDGAGTDEIIVDFGSQGLWARFNNSVWYQLHAFSPARMATGDMDGNGKEELIVDFPGAGIWVWKNNMAWTQLHTLSSSHIAVASLDGGSSKDVIVDFPGAGLWIRYNDTFWAQLHPWSSRSITVGDFDGTGRDDIVVDFAGAGLWAFVNNVGWGQVHPSSAVRLAAGDIDASGRDDLIVDFGSVGIWALLNATTWTQINSQTSQDIVIGDLDGNGKDDVLVSFGASGLWALANNSVWVRLHPIGPKVMAVGRINAP